MVYKIIRKDAAGDPIDPTIDLFYPSASNGNNSIEAMFDSFADARTANLTGKDTIAIRSFDGG